MEVGRADLRSRGVVMEMGVVEGMAKECIGDARARGGWVFTTGEHRVVCLDAPMRGLACVI